MAIIHQASQSRSLYRRLTRRIDEVVTGVWRSCFGKPCEYKHFQSGADNTFLFHDEFLWRRDEDDDE